MKHTTLAVVAAGLIAGGWVSAPPANPAAGALPHATPDHAIIAASPTLAPEPDDDEDENKPRRGRRPTE